MVHVIDVANPSWDKQERAVRAVLADMGVGDKPVVRVLNKIDLLEDEDFGGELIALSFHQLHSLNQLITVFL